MALHMLDILRVYIYFFPIKVEPCGYVLINNKETHFFYYHYCYYYVGYTYPVIQDPFMEDLMM